MKFLTEQYFDDYLSLLKVDVKAAFEQLRAQAWTLEQLRFYTAVSVISSSRIEGETLEMDSYLKHKLSNVEYLPELVEKPNDLFAAYELARSNALTPSNFYAAHGIATQHLLPATRRGAVRQGNMLVIDQQTGRVQYEAAPSSIVKEELEQLWKELDLLLAKELTVEQVFYYASLMHLVLVNIHPFDDGNGRSARLLEKWFLASKLGEKAWYISSERYYYQNLQAYYHNLARVGFSYDELNYEKCLPFLLMLPQAVAAAS
jgi:Fic family protein